MHATKELRIIGIILSYMRNCINKYGEEEVLLEYY